MPHADATVVRKLAEAGAVLVAKTTVGAIAYGELVYDWRTSRSSQSISHAITVNYSLSLVSYKKDQVRVVASTGDLHLGGIDWNQCLLNAVAEQFVE